MLIFYRKMTQAMDLLILLVCLVIASGSMDQIKEIPLDLNKTITLGCPLNKTADTKITWFKDNKPFAVLGGRFATIGMKDLRISSLIYEDEGLYMCSNNKNVSSSPVRLLVLGAPQVQVIFRNNNAPVYEGQSISRICRARGHPQPTVKWFTNKAQRINSSSNSTSPPERMYVLEQLVGNVSYSELKISSVLYSDNGVFTCEAENRHSVGKRTSNVNVHYPPKAVNPSNSTHIVQWWDTTAVNLTCKAEGNPPPTITWSPATDDNEINVTCSLMNIRPTKVESTCWLKSEGNTTYEGGNYSCYAENSLGKILLHDFVVQRIYPPLPVQFRLANITSKEFVMTASVSVKDNSPPAQYIRTRYKDVNGQFKFDLMSAVSDGHAQIVLPGIQPRKEYEISMAAMNLAGYGLWSYMIQDSGTMVTTKPTREENGEILKFNNTVWKNSTSGAALERFQHNNLSNTSSDMKQNSLSPLLCLLFTYLCCQLMFSSNVLLVLPTNVFIKRFTYQTKTMSCISEIKIKNG